MKRILIGYYDSGAVGGLNRVMEKIIRMNAGQYQFDLLVRHEDDDVQRALAAECGVRPIVLAGLSRPDRQIAQLRQIMAQTRYDAVYLHISTALMFAGAWVARKAGVPVRIVHSHASGLDVPNPIIRGIKMMLHYACRPLLYKSATHFFTCSKNAAAFVFSKKVLHCGRLTYVPNNIQLQRYAYDPQTRARMRQQAGAGDDWIIGNVGGLNYAKNHVRLLKVFRRLVALHPQSQLWIIGTGPQHARLERLSAAWGLTDRVKLLGARADVPDWLQAMDAFVLSSRFEGMPLVAIEAQAAGLLCFATDAIAEEAAATELYRTVPRRISPAGWARKIADALSAPAPRSFPYQQLRDNGYEADAYNPLSEVVL